MGSRDKNSFRTHLNFKSYSLNHIQLMRTINLEVKDIKFSMESTKNVQNMNLQLSNKILTKWTLRCPFIIIKSSLEFHSMFPAKHQKIVKGRAKKKPSKLCSTYSHHHRRLGESWRDRVFLSPLPCQCALLYSGAGLYVCTMYYRVGCSLVTGP